MTITAYDIIRVDNVVTVTVTSDQIAEDVTVYYHWYVNGAYVGETVLASRDFYLAPGELARVECVDTLDADYDPLAAAPVGYPARRTLWWIRSTATDVDVYVVDQQKDGGNWTELGRLRISDAWSYSFLTPPLDDLSEYTWRITPVDTAGNEGSALTIGPEDVVRTPDAPNFTVTFDEGTTRVTIAEAS